jgi:hypothetical protein
MPERLRHEIDVILSRQIDNGSASEPLWSYSFSVWPAEKWGHEPSLYELFRFLTGRVEMVFTKDAFEGFRSSLSRQGFTLREVERWPYHEPEPVDRYDP